MSGVGGENCKENFHSKMKTKKSGGEPFTFLSGLELGHENIPRTR